jgi:hypothetical protein
MRWFAEHNDNSNASVEWGFPKDTTAYSYSYADLNEDGLLDQMVTFIPEQCSGGNASMWTQFEVFTVSNGDRYETEAVLGEGLFCSLGQDTTGFYWYDSIGPKKIYGTFYNFKDTDAHCCPSVVRPAILAYDSRKVIYIGDNIGSK